MRRKTKPSSAGRSVAYASVTGVVLSVVSALLLMALLTNLVLTGRVGEKYTRAGIFAIRAISVFLGTFVGGKVLMRNYAKVVAIIVLGQMVLSVMTGIIIYDGSFKYFLTGLVSAVLGSVVAILMLVKPSIPKHKRIK